MQLQHLRRLGLLDSSVPVDRVVKAYDAARELVEEQLAPCVGAGRRGDACFPVVELSSLPKVLATEVRRFLNVPHHVPHATEWAEKPALNPNLDVEAIEAQFREGVAVIDNLLTDEALHELRTLGVHSTVWNEVKAGGYLGALPQEDGFAPPVIAKLARDLERLLPRIFDVHTLLMFWGFKHDTVRAPNGIKAHADTAAINLNFWVVVLQCLNSPSLIARDPLIVCV